MQAPTQAPPQDPILIGKVRDRVLEDMEKHKDQYDASDIEKVRTSDWTVSRFVWIAKQNVDLAVSMAMEAMKWRKSYGVNDKQDSDFPIEFYKIGIIFPYEQDKKGRDVLYIRIKLYRSFQKFTDYFRQFFVHMINKMDVKNNEKGFVMIWDLTGAGPSNWDISMVRFIINSLRNYYPGAMQYLLVYGVPWLMTPFVNIAIKLLPEESKGKIKFVNKEEIFHYVDPTQVPIFLNGRCEVSYREVPKDARECREMALERGFSEEEIESVLKYYEKELA